MAREKPLGTVSGIVILILVLVGALADVLAPYPFYEMHLIDRLQGPSTSYLLGNDEMGRDLLSRLMYGARLSLGIGLAATTLDVMVALLIGGTSGFLGGKFDLAMQRFVDAWIAFPGLAHIADCNVHNGTGCAADDTGAGHFRWHRRLETA